MVTRTGRMIAFYVRKFSGSWQENLQNDGLRAIVKRHGGRGSCFGGTVIHEQGQHLLRIRLRLSAWEPSGCQVGVRSRCLLQRSRRHGCDRKRRALATGEHRGEGQTGVRYVNIGARLAPRCWHIHVDGSHTLIVLSQDPDTSCPLHSARALTQCVCPSSVNSSGGRHNQREPRAVQRAAISTGTQIPKAGSIKIFDCASFTMCPAAAKGPSSSSLVITHGLALCLLYFFPAWTPTRNLICNTILKISEFPLILY